MTSNAAPSGSAWIPTTSRASTCRTGSEDREKGEEQETGSGGDFLSRQDAAPTTRQVGVRLRLTPTCATHVSLSPPFAKGAAAKRRGIFLPRQDAAPAPLTPRPSHPCRSTRRGSRAHPGWAASRRS